MAVSIGSRLGPYEITGLLGAGGMGEVYRARDTKLNRDVAIKVLPPAFAEDATRMARFKREAQLLAALNHPNIAGIYGIEQGALVMEMVEGEDLKGPLPVDTALDYAHQIAEALEAAHEKGIIHRDLKPANIKVTPDGQVKLLDFGLAKATEASSAVSSESPTMSPTLSLAMTQVGMILGTAAYMSPEQARGKPVDRRADIWAFGVVLYEMLTGLALFGRGETISDSLAAVITKEPDWDALPKETPTRIRKLLELCLRKDPKRRLRDIGDARLAIADREPAAVAAAPVSKRRAWLPWTLTGLVLIVAAWMAASIWLRSKPVDMGATRFLLTMPEGNAAVGSPAAPQAVPSPDGRYVAFIARETSSGKDNLWVRPLGSVSAHRLDKTEGANFPFWSPDGQFIAYFADEKLKRIAVSGGSPQTICDAPGQETRREGDGGTWHKDDVIVFSLGTGRGLMLVHAAGGMATALTTLEKDELYHSWPQFLPGGRYLLYFAGSGDAAKSGIYVQELGSSKRVLVMKNALRAAWSPPGYLLFVRESTLFAQRMNPKSFRLEGAPASVAEEVTSNEANGRAAFAVSESGLLVYRGGVLNRPQQLAWYDREGKRLGAIGKPGEFSSFWISPDEKSAAMTVGSRLSSDTWIMDLNTGVLTKATLDNRSSSIIGPWSPDSQRMAINQAVRGGISELTVASRKTRILVPDTLYANDWSPDGRSLLCTDADEHRLSVLPLEGEGKPQTILNTPYQIRMFRFSPDGRWVAYASNDGGPFEISVASYPSFAEKRKVSSGGGSMPFWRKDGREILFVAPDRTLMRAEIKTGSRLEPGTPKPLFKLPSRGPAAFLSVAVTGDGRRFLVTAPESPEQDAQIVMVLNWTAELKQQ